MYPWIRLDDCIPSEGQFVVAITQHDHDVPVEVWEGALEKNAVGTWIEGVIWEGNVPRQGFTHWMPLPDRPVALPPSGQAEFWYWTRRGTWEPERRRSTRPAN